MISMIWVCHQTMQTRTSWATPNDAKSYIVSSNYSIIYYYVISTQNCCSVSYVEKLISLYKYYTLILNTQYSIVKMYVCCCCYAILARENGRALWYWNFVIILWSRGYFWYQFVSFFLLQNQLCIFFMLYIIMIFIIWSKVGFRGLLFFWDCLGVIIVLIGGSSNHECHVF